MSSDMDGELHSHNDVKIIRDVLMGEWSPTTKTVSLMADGVCGPLVMTGIYGYASNDIVVMLDDAGTPVHLQPSRANIVSFFLRLRLWFNSR